MRPCYFLNGLALSSGFPLPMPPHDTEVAPALRLDRVAPPRLRARWRERTATWLWSGRLGDGRALQAWRSEEGSALFVYAGRASFLFDPVRRSLWCSPQSEGLHWLRVLLTKVLPFVSVMQGFEALHASAVETPEGALAILAASGAGKSTLAAELLGRGGRLICDDILTLERTAGGVRACPGSPHMNLPVLAAEPDAPPRGNCLGVLDGERWLAVDECARRPSPIRALCLLTRGMDGPLRVRRLRPAPQLLAPYMLGFDAGQARARARFATCAELAASAATLEVSVGPRDRAGEIAEAIEAELQAAASPTMLGVGA